MSARIDGADLSHWQNGIVHLDHAAQDGARFLHHKATEGLDYKDVNYPKRRIQAHAVRMPFGGYHFARPAVSGGRDQARYFLAYAGPKNGDVRGMLDLEDRAGLNITQLTDWALDWVTEYHARTGHWPFVYTQFDLEKRFLRLTDCPLWVSRYSNPMYPPRVVRPWKAYTIWQFSNGVYGVPNQLAGIGHCDLNTMNSPAPASLLANFIIGARPTPVKPVKPTKPRLKTRIQKVRIALATHRLVDVKQLDTAVTLGRRGAVKRARDQVDQAIAELRHSCGTEQKSRVAKVLDQYAHDRTVDVHLLDQAVDAGRTRAVKTCRDAIVAAISHTLPRR